MAIRCESCGEQNRDGAQWCEFCKELFVRRPLTPLPAPAPPSPGPPPRARVGWSTRAVVTIAALNLALGLGVGVLIPSRHAAPPPPVVAAPAPRVVDETPDAGLLTARVEEVEDAGGDEVLNEALEEVPDAGEPAHREVVVLAAPPPEKAPVAERKPRVFTVPYVPWEGSARRIIIPVTFDGSVKARLALDTGAPGTVIFTPLAARLGALETNEGRLVTMANGIGGQRAAALVVLNSLCVDAACTEFVPATVTEPMSDAFEGLVGMDFLGGYQVALDTSRHVLTLTESPRPDTPGGHEERWWRDTFAYFASEKESWSRLHASLVSRLERSESPPGLNLEQTRQLLEFSASQTRQLELLSSRLERHASFNSVPREWRRYP